MTEPNNYLLKDLLVNVLHFVSSDETGRSKGTEHLRECLDFPGRARKFCLQHTAGIL